MSLTDRIAIVTGGGKGIGRAIVQRLMQDGATVASVDLDEAAPPPQGPGTYVAMTCDVSDPDQVGQLAETVHRRFGRCDILVNNVGIFPPCPFAELTHDEFRHVLAVNVESTFLMSKTFGEGMQERGWGRIVNLGSSITSSQSRELLAYLTSKAAVHGLTRALANELGPAGVTVNAVAPSFIATEGTRSRTRDVNGLSVDEEQALLVSHQTLKRPQQPSDVAKAVAFLVSDDADFVTGQILHVDGGLSRGGA